MLLYVIWSLISSAFGSWEGCAVVAFPGYLHIILSVIMNYGVQMIMGGAKKARC